MEGKPKRDSRFMWGRSGTAPQQAKLFDEFLAEEELMPLSQAICRVFARLGEKKNRNTARLKFLITKLGLEEFKRLVAEERATLTPDPRWTEYIAEVHSYGEEPAKRGEFLQIRHSADAAFQSWYDTNVYGQRQAGYATVTIALPLGDITSDQLRALADIARRYTRETVRTTVEQNLVLRWVSESICRALSGFEGRIWSRPVQEPLWTLSRARNRHLQTWHFFVSRTRRRVA
ncbi:MAG: hypothetical protein WKF37_11370 [Bryobacteraceae bacterium]